MKPLQFDYMEMDIEDERFRDLVDKLRDEIIDGTLSEMEYDPEFPGSDGSTPSLGAFRDWFCNSVNDFFDAIEGDNMDKYGGPAVVEYLRNAVQDEDGGYNPSPALEDEAEEIYYSLYPDAE